MSNFFKRLARYNIKDKNVAVDQYIRYGLDKAQRMHRFENLPLTIPKRILVKYLHLFGHVILAKGPDGSLLAYRGNPGFEPDFYNEGTKVNLISHLPGHDRVATLGVDAVLVRNDSEMVGLMPIIEKYAVYFAELDLTEYNQIIWSRIPFILAADDDKTKQSADHFLEQIEAGKLSIISSATFTDGIMNMNYSHPAGAIKEIIELRATIKAQFYEELGLNINGNMKREYVSSDEIAQSDPSVLPFIEDMTENIETGLLQANALFGTDMHVYINSSWAIQGEMAYGMAGTDYHATSDETFDEPDAEEPDTQPEPEHEPEPEPDDPVTGPNDITEEVIDTYEEELTADNVEVMHGDKD